MNPSQKVTTLETSRLLKEAGWNVETERWWNLMWLDGELDSTKLETTPLDRKFFVKRHSRWTDVQSIAAPDAAELGEALPKGFTAHKSSSVDRVSGELKTIWVVEKELLTEEGPQWFDIGQSHAGYSGPLERIERETEAEARAAAWLFLRKQGLV